MLTRFVKLSNGEQEYWVAPNHVAYVKNLGASSQIGLRTGEVIIVDGAGEGVADRLLKAVR